MIALSNVLFWYVLNWMYSGVHGRTMVRILRDILAPNPVKVVDYYNPGLTCNLQDSHALVSEHLWYLQMI